MKIDCETETPNDFAQRLQARAHTFRADATVEQGGADTAPGAHDYFDAALAACKTITAMWVARKHGIPLERVESHVERDASKEREGVYVLRVRLAFHGPMTDEQRAQLYRSVAHCPVHKLMTTADVQIETEPLAPA